MLDRISAPQTNFDIKLPFQLPQATKILSTSNFPFYVLNMGSQDVIRIEWIFENNPEFEKIKGITFFSFKMLLESIKNYTSFQLQEEIASLGAFIDIAIFDERTIITAHCMPKCALEISLLVSKMINEAMFLDSDFQLLKDRTIKNLEISLQKNSYLAQQKFKSQVFGENHPLGKNLIPADLINITIEDLIYFYNEQIVKTLSHCILSGKIEPSLAKEITNINFSSTFKDEKSTQLKIVASNLKPIETYFQKDSSVQTSIRLGCITIPRTHPDFHKLNVTNTVLGGYFGSRLMQNIREDKGYTYGISSSIVSHNGFSYFVIGSDVVKEKANDTIKEINYEIKRLAETSIDDEELQSVKNYLIGHFLNNINSPFSISDKNKFIAHLHLGPDYYNNYLMTLINIKKEDISEMTKKYLQVPLISVLVG